MGGGREHAGGDDDDSFRLFFDGQRLNGNDTPMSLGMVDGDALDLTKALERPSNVLFDHIGRQPRDEDAG